MRILLFMSALLLSSCNTVFQGSAYVSNGVSGCTRKCQQWGMELTGMVAMGEYSNGCICKKRGAANDEAMLEAGAAEGAVAGVQMQMQQSETVHQR